MMDFCAGLLVGGIIAATTLMLWDRYWRRPMLYAEAQPVRRKK